MTGTFARGVRTWALASTASIALAAIASASDGRFPDAAVQFDIETTTLGAALEAFALQANVEVLAPSQLVVTRQAPRVSGQLTPRAALEQLLLGSGLRYHINEHNTVLIAEAEARDNDGVRRAQPGVEPINSQSYGEPETSGRAVPADVAGSGSVQGRVTDAATGSGLSGAIVRVAGTNRVVSTDARGFYRFSGLPAGQHRIEVDYLGADRSAAEVRLSARDQVEQHFQLRFSADVITVYGYRSSLAQALSQQRAAANASTVVSADLLGSFPAETVSEAMRRLPGVAFARNEDTGEGSAITIRGFSSEAINIQLNGIDLQGTGFTRTIDLSGVLADNISQIVIQKSLLPSMESTGSGGLVQIETRSGLDYGDGEFSIGYEREQSFDSHFGNEYQVNTTFARRLADNFGVSGSIQYRETSRTNYDVSILGDIPPVLPAGVASLFNVPSSRSFPFDPAFDNQLINSTSYVLRERDESNLTASLNFAWDVASHTRLRLDLQHMRREATNVAARGSVGFLPARVDAPIEELGGEVRRRTFINSFRPVFETIASDIRSDLTTISFRGDTEIEQWTLRYKAGYSHAVSRTEHLRLSTLSPIFTGVTSIIDPATIVMAPDNNGVMRVADGAFITVGDQIAVPSLNQAGWDMLFDPGIQNVQTATLARTDSPSETYILEGSGRYTFASGFLDYLEAGIKYDRNQRTSIDGTFATTVAGLLASQSYTAVAGRPTFLSDFGVDALSAMDLARIGASGYSIPYLSAVQVRSIFSQIPNYLEDDPSTSFNEHRFNLVDRDALDPILDGAGLNPSETTEERFAGYVEAMVRFDRLEVAGGVRYERVERDGMAVVSPTFRDDNNQLLPRELFVQAGLIGFESTGGVQDTWTPSLLATWRHTEQLVARLGYFRTTVNPDFRLLSRAPQYLVNLNATGFNARTGIIRESNPDLQPTVTHNLDLDLAYYFQDTPGLVRFGVFYKDTSNNFTSVLFSDEPGEVRERLLAFFAPLNDIQPGVADLPADLDYMINRPVNGDGGTIWGVEAELIRQLDFLPGFWRDFGVLFNVTYTNGNFPTLVSGRSDDGEAITLSLNRPLADQARWAGTASVNYERGPFSGRIIYTYQSATVDVYSPVDLNTVTPEFSTLDLRVQYVLDQDNYRATLYLQGDDLLNGSHDADIRSATGSTYSQSSADFFFPSRLQFRGGRSFTAGLRVNF